MKLREYPGSNIDLDNETDFGSGEESPKSTAAFNFPLLVNILKRRAGLIALTTGIGALVGLSALFFQKETYKGSFYLLVEPVSSAGKYTNPDAIARGENSSSESNSLDYPTNLVFLKSPGMSARIAKEITKKYPKKSFPSVWFDIRKNLDINRIGDTAREATKIFEVTYEGSDPDMVQKTLEASAEAFIKYSQEDRRTSIRYGLDFIDKQIPGLEKILANLERQRQKIREDDNLIDPSTEGVQINKNLGEINSRITEAQINLNQEQILYNQLSQQLKLSPQEALAASNINQDPIYSSQLKQLKDIQTQLAIASADLTPGHPQVVSLQAKEKKLEDLLQQRIAETLAQNDTPNGEKSSVLRFQGTQRMALISELINTYNKIESSQYALKALQASKMGLERQSKAIPGIINRYNQLDRDILVNKQVLDKLWAQKETLQVQVAQDLPWQVISKPQIPMGTDGLPIAEKSSGNKLLFLMLGSGVLLGAILAIALEKYKNVFQTAKDLELTLNVPLLGEIPQLLEEDLENDKLVLRKPFEYLYSNLNIIYRDPKVRSLVVRSIDDQEGQELVALNLAKMAAANGKKVLLVDADLDNCRLHDELNLNNKAGLTDLISGNKNLSEVIQQCKDFESLYFISGGTKTSWMMNPLASSMMNDLIKKFDASYDLAIYSPSSYYDLTEISDLVLSTDGLLLAVLIKQTSQTKVKDEFNKILSQKLPILGVVALEVPRDQMKSSTFSSSPVQLVQENQNGSSNFLEDLSTSDKYK